MTVKICHLWADALNWNGSQGNLICLKKRLEWRGISVEVTEIPVGAPVDFEIYDLVYIGAGKAYENHKLMRDVATKSTSLQQYAANGGTILAVCEGYELLGKIVALSDGSTRQGVGVLPIKTVYGEERKTGNALMETAYGNVVYFENHVGMVYPEEDIATLGRVIKGHGSNGMDGFAGVRYENVFACHAHGPLLPKNPALADEILRTALFRQNPQLELPPLDDTLEHQAHQVMVDRLK